MVNALLGAALLFHAQSLIREVSVVVSNKIKVVAHTGTVTLYAFPALSLPSGSYLGGGNDKACSKMITRRQLPAGQESENPTSFCRLGILQ